jgi:stress-induced morphogen
MQSTTELLLRKLDSLLEAFPRHYLAVQDRDAVAQMIQRDCWTHFQVEVAKARQKIRCELEALND